MHPVTASSIARRAHQGQADRFGAPLVDHVARVAVAVPGEAQSVAWLHDLLEHTDTSIDALRRAGLTDVEAAALDLLTRRRGESYELHTLRLAFAAGTAGRLARLVKRADLDDHISDAPFSVDAPPYAWARRHIRNAQWRNRESAAGAREEDVAASRAAV